MPRLVTGECFGERCFLEMRPLWGNTACVAGSRGAWVQAKPGCFLPRTVSKAGRGHFHLPSPLESHRVPGYLSAGLCRVFGWLWVITCQWGTPWSLLWAADPPVLPETGPEQRLVLWNSAGVALQLSWQYTLCTPSKSSFYIMWGILLFLQHSINTPSSWTG